MLRCPKCGNTYTDETLRFCLADGTVLERVRADGPAAAFADAPSPRGVPRRFKILLGVVAFAAVAGSIAMAAFLIFVNKNAVRGTAVAPNATADGQINAAAENVRGPSGEAMAKVNSPKDGFLALRVMPDARSGEPLAKIPHGTTIRLGYCRQEDARVDTRDGHWCMTSYDGKSGWVFDAWLDREN